MAATVRIGRARSSDGHRRVRDRRIAFRVALYSVLGVAAAASVYPFALMILDSLKSNTQVLLNTGGWPTPATTKTYSQMASGGGLRAFVNSAIVACATTVGAVFLSAAAGYAFAKLRFRGRQLMFAILLLTIMVPIQTAIPGFYFEFAKIHWLNSYQIQIVPFIAPVFGLFMVRQYCLAVPDEFLEAARLAGANEWHIFTRIMVPILRPVLAALAVLTFLLSWNNYLWPEIMASSPSVAPLPFVLPTFTDPMGLVPHYGTIMAGCVLATGPLIVLFLRYQKAFVTGITYGEG